uniref:Uncharacterized protein n=1 Tax=Panagrolaimus superbus TaxID=310955 RepID=A0A914XYI2_9BILA
MISKSNKAALQLCAGNKSTSIEPSVPRNYLMMPKIEFDKFFGDDKKWLLWLKRYSTIHNNPTIPDEDKLNMLLSLRDGEPKELLSNLNITAENYALAMSMLTAKYGESKQTVKKLLAEFNELRCFGVTVAETRQCFSSDELILNQLEIMGENVNDQKSIQVHWENNVIPDWLYESCLMRISKDSIYKILSFLSS